MRVPSGLNAACETNFVWPSRMWVCRPLWASQSRTVLSQAPGQLHGFVDGGGVAQRQEQDLVGADAEQIHDTGVELGQRAIEHLLQGCVESAAIAQRSVAELGGQSAVAAR